jgi:hypothetical protein
VSGKLYPKETMFFRQHVGEAKSDNLAYEMSFNVSGNAPIVHSKQTGQWWTISWQELLELAVVAGIDKPITKESKSKRTSRREGDQ